MIIPFCSWAKKSKYRFTLLYNFQIQLDLDCKSNLLFQENNVGWGTLKNNYLNIKSGFSWDGCSPSQLFGIKWLSTPSPAETIAASLCHDFFYQYIGTANCPWDRAWADGEFKRILDMNNFKYAGVYYAAVRACGGIVLSKKQDVLRNTEIILLNK